MLLIDICLTDTWLSNSEPKTVCQTVKRDKIQNSKDKIQNSNHLHNVEHMI